MSLTAGEEASGQASFHSQDFSNPVRIFNNVPTSLFATVMMRIIDADSSVNWTGELSSSKLFLWIAEVPILLMTPYRVRYPFS